MSRGNHNSKIFLILISLYFSPLFAEIKLDLQTIQPTFEEESDSIDDTETGELNYIKSKKRKKTQTTETIVNLRALDKITAKTLDINIVLGKKKKIWLFRNITKKL